MYSSLETSMRDLHKAKLLQLAMRGPNLNWNVLNILRDKLEFSEPKTLNIGSCTQHTVHWTSKGGFQKSSWKIEKLFKSAFWPASK